MALASRSCSSFTILRLRQRYTAPNRLVATLYRPLPSSAARLQLNAAASSSIEAAGNDDGIIAAAPVEVDAAAAAEPLGTAATSSAALPGYPDNGQPSDESQPKEEGNLVIDIMSSPSPPGQPQEGTGGNGGAYN